MLGTVNILKVLDVICLMVLNILIAKNVINKKVWEDGVNGKNTTILKNLILKKQELKPMQTVV